MLDFKLIKGGKETEKPPAKLDAEFIARGRINVDYFQVDDLFHFITDEQTFANKHKLETLIDLITGVVEHKICRGWILEARFLQEAAKHTFAGSDETKITFIIKAQRSDYDDEMTVSAIPGAVVKQGEALFNLE